MLFHEIQHQERAVSILRRALAGGRIHHAYLFEGPEGVGKETAARVLAAGLLCLDPRRRPEDEPCGRCDSCRLLKSDNHPDYRLIHRGLHKLHPDKSIRSSTGLFLVVDLIRHFLIEPATNRPTLGSRRVFLIRDAERMNEEAQNALLKTLEEPPGAACLILVTAAAARLLPTIRSRCQRIPFDLLPTAFVAEQLQARCGTSSAQARALAALAEGRLGVAIHWQQIDLLAALDAASASLADLPSGDTETFGKRLVDLAAELAIRARGAAAEDNGDPDEEATTSSSGKSVATDELRDALKLVYLLVAVVHREALVHQAGAPALRVLADLSPRAVPWVQSASLDHLEANLRAVAEAERMLDRNVAPQLVCERLGIALLGDAPVS